MIYTKITIMAALLFLSNTVVAKESKFGVGVGINDYFTIQLPIEIEGLLIEPSISIHNRNEDSSSPSEIYKNEREEVRTIVGIFKNISKSKVIQYFYGIKLGYISSKYNDSRVSTSSNTSYSTETDGYLIAPTFGVQYYFLSNMSIGIDVSFTYTDKEGERINSVSSSTEISDTDLTEYATESEIVLRYYFE